MTYAVQIKRVKRIWSKERYYWIVRHDNGNVLLTSEMYHNLVDVREIAGKFARINRMEFIDL